MRTSLAWSCPQKVAFTIFDSTKAWKRPGCQFPKFPDFIKTFLQGAKATKHFEVIYLPGLCKHHIRWPSTNLTILATKEAAIEGGTAHHAVIAQETYQGWHPAPGSRYHTSLQGSLEEMLGAMHRCQVPILRKPEASSWQKGSHIFLMIQKSG